MSLPGCLGVTRETQPGAAASHHRRHRSHRPAEFDRPRARVHPRVERREDAGRMAKRLFLLHIGPHTVDTLAMAETLAVGGVALPDVGEPTLRHAGLELTRTHKAAGLKRAQVEGSWARVCRRAWK